MSTFKSYIFHCAFSLKLNTSELDMAEIMDNTATLKAVRFFFPPFKSRNRNTLVGRVFLALGNMVCRLGQASMRRDIFTVFEVGPDIS